MPKKSEKAGCFISTNFFTCPGSDFFEFNPAAAGRHK